MMKYYYLVFFLLCVSCDNNKLQTKELVKKSKEIKSLIKASRNKSYPDSLRLKYINQAMLNVEKESNDSLKTKFLISIAYSYLNLGDINEFGVISLKNLHLAVRIKDSLKIARVKSDLGYFYQSKFQSDSAFYYYNSAFNIYSLIGDKEKEGKSLLSMATIQSIEKDFVGSEINTFKAISKLKNSGKNKLLFLCYNNLAFIYNQLEKYDESIKYRQLARKFILNLKQDKGLELMALNGIGLSYRKKGDFINSIKYFNKGLKIDGIAQNHPEIFSMLIDNLGYSKFKIGDLKEALELFHQSKNIRDSLNIINGIIESNFHLAEYKLFQKDTIAAIEYVKRSKELANQSNLYIDLFSSYFFLSKIESPEKGVKYLQKYVKLSDSLQQQEREIREKFTRIAYETDEITKENKVIAKKNWWLTIAIIIGCAFFTVIYFYIRQRSKNKELLFSKKQEEANVEIYNLMISEKTKFEEGSIKERNRISEELHDGIVNKLFAIRLRLLLLNEGKTKKDIDGREKHLEELQNIEEEIRTVSHELKVELFNVDNSFEKMVKDLVIKRSNLSNFEWNLSFNIHRKWESVANKIKIHCYRTIQEALQNIHKYAQATEVEIRFTEDEQLLLVEIIDNGIGFNPKNKSNGIGLKNIESRISKLNGSIEILSSIGEGTKIIMNIPL